MNSLAFQLAYPIEEDARLIFEWRNDPLTREMSRNQHELTWEFFYPNYLKRYFSIPALPPQFIVFEGRRVGILFFEPIPLGAGTCEISINIAPQSRGQHIGSEALQHIQPWVLRQGFHRIYALIKKGNSASISSFTHAGFSKVAKDHDCDLYAVTLKKEVKAPVFIIAEAGSNWRTEDGTDSQAKRLIEVAAEAGCDAVKFQIFKPETTYVRNAGHAEYLGNEKKIWDIFHDLAMPYAWIEKLADFASERGIKFMASPFSLADFEAIAPFSDFVKIASYEITHFHLIDAAAVSQKRTFLSTGAAKVHEIDWAVNRYLEKGGKNLNLMQCTAKYPAEPSTMHLQAIPFLMQRYQVPVGLSDHSRHPTIAPVAAVALGASVIEKHFTLDNNLPGPDHCFALTPPELNQMVEAIRTAEEMRGVYGKWLDPSEMELRTFAQRRIQAIVDIKAGDTFVEGKNIAILRPGIQEAGVKPGLMSEIQGKVSQRNILEGDGIRMGDWE